MEVSDLTPEHHDAFCVCLDDWSEEMTKEAGPRRGSWYDRMTARGLRVLLCKDDDGEIGGMIQYAPIERSIADGEGLYFIYDHPEMTDTRSA